jgi:hypothetical protein
MAPAKPAAGKSHSGATDAITTPVKSKFTLKQSINPKASPTGSSASSKIQWYSVPSNDPNSRAIAFTIVRESGPTDSSWADKIAFDFAVDRNPNAFKRLGAYKTIFKLHDLDVELPSYKAYGRRLYFFFTEEIPNDEQLLDFSQQIAEIINQSPSMNPHQHLQVYPADLWTRQNVAFVEILGNRQTDKLARELLPGNNVAEYFVANPQAIQTFWKPGTMSLSLAQSYGLDNSMVKHCELI